MLLFANTCLQIFNKIAVARVNTGFLIFKNVLIFQKNFESNRHHAQKHSVKCVFWGFCRNFMDFE